MCTSTHACTPLILYFPPACNCICGHVCVNTLLNHRFRAKIKKKRISGQHVHSPTQKKLSKMQMRDWRVRWWKKVTTNELIKMGSLDVNTNKYERKGKMKNGVGQDFWLRSIFLLFFPPCIGMAFFIRHIKHAAESKWVALVGFSLSTPKLLQNKTWSFNYHCSLTSQSTPTWHYLPPEGGGERKVSWREHKWEENIKKQYKKNMMLLLE